MSTVHEAISLIKSCTKKTHFFQLHCHLIRSSLFHNYTIFASFLHRLILSPFRDLSYSCRLFSQFPKPDVSLYNTMIRGHSLARDSARKGYHFYQEMLHSGISSNAMSSTFALKCCMKIESLESGMQVHGRILKDGNMLDTLLMTTMMDFYSCFEKGGDARKLFDEMSHRDAVAWNVLVSNCLRNGETEEVLRLFQVMREEDGCEPDDVTCLLALQACGSLNALGFGQKVHKYVVECGFDRVMNVCNALIAMYSRCGSMEKAYDVFKKMGRKDVVSWSAMISGLASNGYGRDAIEAFGEMQRAGVLPDDQTFTGVLSACSHSGLIDEARMFFDCMRTKFGIVPNIHHYGCVVDLLGRAGLLEEAYNLISSMKIKPDAWMWRTLLGACKNHRHDALGARVIEHLTELEAQEVGDYVLLLNIYTAMGNSEKVLEVRSVMEEQGIQTTPACSTLGLKGELHEFKADDISHPRTKEIYETLDEINQQLRIAGYVAEVTPELQNVDSEGKEYTLSYHSEKLAIAFGALSTPPGTTIRVAKNLYMCMDCHNFCKIFSAVYDRKLVVRDRSSFHRFQGGRCSCND